MNLPHARTSRLVVAVAAISLITAACGASDDDSDGDDAAPAVADEAVNDVAGEWVAIAGEVGGEPVTLLPSGPITIEIDADGASVNGRAACNSYGGGATFDADGGLSFGDLAVTEMGCVESAVMQLEGVYVGSLAGLDRWELDGETLLLSGGDAEWRFEAVIEESALSGAWRVTEGRVGGEPVDISAGSLTVEVEGERIVGEAACNGYDGIVSVGDGQLAITELFQSAMACAEPLNELESIFMRSLAELDTWAIEDGRLLLSNDDDEWTLETTDRTVTGRGDTGDPEAPVSSDEDAPTEPVGLSDVSVRPVLACGEESLTVEADIVQVDPAQQLDCALGPPISDGPVFAADAEASPGPTGQWQVSVRIADGARGDWDAAATECFERGAECPTGQLAIVANGAIASAPTVQTPTFPGEIVISGAFTESDARSIAASINANS